jgi:dCMP deaminase
MVKSNDLKFLQKAKVVSSISSDPSTKTGCVLTLNGEYLSTGYNNMPFGKPDWWEDRATKLKLVIHAEIDALINRSENFRGFDAYIFPWMPCGNCCSALVRAGVKRIVAPKLDQVSDRYQRWKDDFELTRDYCKQAGVELVEVEFE